MRDSLITPSGRDPRFLGVLASLSIATTALASCVKAGLLAAVWFRAEAGADAHSEELLRWAAEVDHPALVINAISGVVFIGWMRRTFGNLASTRRPTHWAVTGWFVPILNFQIPFEIAAETYSESVLDAKYRPGPGAHAPSVVIGWWGTFLTSHLLALLFVLLPSVAPVAQHAVGACMMAMLTFTAAAVAIRMVRDISLAQARALR